MEADNHQVEHIHLEEEGIQLGVEDTHLEVDIHPEGEDIQLGADNNLEDTEPAEHLDIQD